jgi:exopolysaccharide biosynthesis polyprenyl glycosylphosphotransferase
VNGDTVATLPAHLAAEFEAKRTGRRETVAIRRRRGPLVQRALVVADVTGLFLAFLTTAVIFGPGSGRQNHLALGAEYGLFLLTLPLWALGAKLYELYDRDEERADHSTLDDAVGVFHLVTAGAWLLYLGGHLTGLVDPELAKVATFWGLSLVFVVTGRFAARAYCRRRPGYVQNAIIVGAGEVGQLVGRKLQQHPEYGINLVGFVDADPLPLRVDLDHQRVLGPPRELESLVREHGVERVVVAFVDDSTADTVDLVRLLKRLDVQTDIVPRLFDAVGPNVVVHAIEGLPLLGLPSSKLLPFSRGIKRTIDLVGASVMLLLASPVFAFVAWRVHRDSPGPIFFRQSRLGEGMREFEALKFRTMYVDTDDSAHREFIQRTMTSKAAPDANGLYKLERNDAITRSGRWLRRTSLDELPNLINVLRGEMSLVGPRPCIRYEIDSFEPRHFERFLVPAGVTGLWQVTARAHATFGEALDMDVAYARNWSLALDLWLLLRTPFTVFRRAATR